MPCLLFLVLALVARALACACDGQMPMPGTLEGSICGGCPPGTYRLDILPPGYCSLDVLYAFGRPVTLNVSQDGRVVRSCGPAAFCSARFPVDPAFATSVEWGAARGVPYATWPVVAPRLDLVPCAGAPARPPAPRLDDAGLRGSLCPPSRDLLCPGQAATYSIPAAQGQAVYVAFEFNATAAVQVAQSGFMLFNLVAAGARELFRARTSGRLTLTAQTTASPPACVEVRALWFSTLAAVAGVEELHALHAEQGRALDALRLLSGAAQVAAQNAAAAAQDAATARENDVIAFGAADGALALAFVVAVAVGIWRLWALGRDVSRALTRRAPGRFATTSRESAVERATRGGETVPLLIQFANSGVLKPSGHGDGEENP